MYQGGKKENFKRKQDHPQPTSLSGRCSPLSRVPPPFLLPRAFCILSVVAASVHLSLHHLLTGDWAPCLHLSPPHPFSPEQPTCVLLCSALSAKLDTVTKNKQIKLTKVEILAKYIIECLDKYFGVWRHPPLFMISKLLLLSLNPRVHLLPNALNSNFILLSPPCLEWAAQILPYTVAPSAGAFLKPGSCILISQIRWDWVLPSGKARASWVSLKSAGQGLGPRGWV